MPSLSLSLLCSASFTFTAPSAFIQLILIVEFSHFVVSKVSLFFKNRIEKENCGYTVILVFFSSDLDLAQSKHNQCTEKKNVFLRTQTNQRLLLEFVCS